MKRCLTTVAVAALVITGGTAIAQSPEPVLEICVNNRSGVMRWVGSPEECRANETAKSVTVDDFSAEIADLQARVTELEAALTAVDGRLASLESLLAGFSRNDADPRTIAFPAGYEVAFHEVSTAEGFHVSGHLSASSFYSGGNITAAGGIGAFGHVMADYDANGFGEFVACTGIGYGCVGGGE